MQSASHHQKLYETLFLSNCSVNQTHDQVGRNRKLLYVGLFFLIYLYTQQQKGRFVSIFSIQRLDLCDISVHVSIICWMATTPFNSLLKRIAANTREATWYHHLIWESGYGKCPYYFLDACRLKDNSYKTKHFLVQLLLNFRKPNSWSIF